MEKTKKKKRTALKKRNIRILVTILVFCLEIPVFGIQKTCLSCKKCKTVIQYLRIIATDFKYFQSSSLIDQSPVWSTCHCYTLQPILFWPAIQGMWLVWDQIMLRWCLVSWDCLTQLPGKPSCHILWLWLIHSLSLREPSPRLKSILVGQGLSLGAWNTPF